MQEGQIRKQASKPCGGSGSGVNNNSEENF